MTGRAQLFVGRLPIDIRERDVEQVFEKYGRLIRCDVKYGMFGSSGRRGSERMYGSSGRRGSGRTGMAYAFVDYDDRRDAEAMFVRSDWRLEDTYFLEGQKSLDAIKYENGREIRGQSIVVEWARGPSYRSGGRENYGRSSRQSGEECYRCRRTGHWARDCPELERDRYYPRTSRRHSRSRSRSRSYRRRRSVSRSRSKSRDRRRRSSSDYRQKSRSLSRERKRKVRSPSVSVSPSKSPSRSRSRSHGKSRKKEKSKKSKVREPSKSPSRSPSLNKSRSRSRSPSYSRKISPSPLPENDYADKHDDDNRSRSVTRSPCRSISRSPSKENNRSDDNESDHSVSRSKSR